MARNWSSEIYTINTVPIICTDTVQNKIHNYYLEHKCPCTCKVQIKNCKYFFKRLIIHQLHKHYFVCQILKYSHLYIIRYDHKLSTVYNATKYFTISQTAAQPLISN